MSDTIQVIRGDDVNLSLTFTDSSTGLAIDITGATVFFTVKNSLDDADAAALLQAQTASHTNPTAGLTTIALTAAQTDIVEGLYFYDFQIKTAAGKINSSVRGTFEVFKDVTTRTS